MQKKSFFIYVILALLPVVIMTSYILMFLPPKFNSFIIEDTKSEAMRVANHLSSIFIHDPSDVANQQNIEQLAKSDEQLRKELQLTKLKLFLPSGEAIYSSIPEEIGIFNDGDYFSDIVAKGNAYSNLVKKESSSLEGQWIQSDVVETYVPIMSDGRFIGAFEIYYDITETKAKLTRLTNKIYLVLVLVSLFLMSVIVFSLVKVKKSIKNQKKYEQTLHKLSITDELTGLLNRRGFMTLAEQQKVVAERSEQRLIMVYSDIDGMKWINDNLGHDVGDEALKETAKLLRMTFRKADVLCRLGGDEFAVLLANDHAETCTAALEKRFYKNLETINRKPGRRFSLQVSLGVYCYCKDVTETCSLDELMTRADKLMYARKLKRKKCLTQCASCH